MRLELPLRTLDVRPRTRPSLLPLPLAAALLVGCAPPPRPCSCPAPAPHADPAPRPAKLDELGQQRVDLARKRSALVHREFDGGYAKWTDVLAADRDIAFAARDSGLRGAVLQTTLETYRQATYSLRDAVQRQYAKGSTNEEDVARIQAAVAEAEFWVAEAAGH